MVKGGAEPAHKLPGVAGSNIGIKVIHKGTDGPVGTLEDGQYHGSGLCQQPGRYSLQGAGETVQGAVDMVSNITIKAQHLPGRLNQVADSESRTMLERSDWKLDSRVFQQIHQLWGPMEVDLFASRLTTQCPVFFSWRPDPYAAATDGLPPNLDGAQGIYKSAMEFGGTSGSTGSGSASLAGASSTCVEDPALVPNSTGDAGRCPTPDSPTETSNKSLTDENPSASRLAHIREKCRDHKLS